MSYRTHGLEHDPLSPGAPSPYTPDPDRYFFPSDVSTPGMQEHSNPDSDNLRPQLEHIRYASSSSQQPMLRNQAPYDKSVYKRTFSNLSKRTPEMMRRWSIGIHWYVPTSMVLVFLLGCAGALAHHLFYLHLDDKPAVNQLMMIRYGTGLAFFTKATLVGSVVLSYRQRIWQTLREKTVSIRGLDGMFSVIEDPTWFVLAPEIFKKARVASVLAVATWVIPIASVLSPGSLTTHLREVYYPGTCDVRTINFTQEADGDWRHPRFGRMGYSLAFFNTTPPVPAISVADWYIMPSNVADKITKLALFSYKVVAEPNSPCPGFNCTYRTEIVAPWYNCTPAKFSDPGSPFEANDFVPLSKPVGSSLEDGESDKNYIYRSSLGVGQSEYKIPQDDYNSLVYTTQGIIDSDPDLWIGYVVNTTTLLPKGSDPRWTHKMEQHAAKCVHQKAKYSIDSVWVNNRLDSRKATVTNGVELLKDGERVGPEIDQEEYKGFIPYYTMGFLLRGIIKGELVHNHATSNVVVHGQISASRLVDQVTTYVVDNFVTAFANFYEELVMSLISEPYLEIANELTVVCKRSRWESRFKYSPASLWVGYSIAIFVTFCSIIIGTYSIRQNGMCSDTTFSKILVTTRNKTLDKLVMSYPGVALGGDPIPKELEHTQLRFGVIDFDQNGLMEPLLMKHTAFGLAEETTTIRRKDVEEALELQDDREIELGNRGPYFPGAGLGALPG